MRLYIPKPGDVIRLIEDWTFDLYNEDRNLTLLSLAGRSSRTEQRMERAPYTLRAGAKLKFDRIYIRKGSIEYDSVSFFLVGEHANVTSWYEPENAKKVKRAVRFWVKLGDAYMIEYEPEVVKDPTEQLREKRTAEVRADAECRVRYNHDWNASVMNALKRRRLIPADVNMEDLKRPSTLV